MSPGGLEAAAYGFRVAGVDHGGWLALRDVADWPVLTVRVAAGQDLGPPGSQLDEDRASVRTPSGRLVLHRADRTITVHAGDSVGGAELVHPALSPAAAIFARWAGMETLHAGAFLAGDGGEAWAVLGARGAGKSSLLAALAMDGAEVMVDDLVIIDGGDCFAGPRCLDLRPPAAEALGLGSELRTVRSTQRQRFSLGDAPARARLGGFIQMVWGDRTAWVPLRPAERLRELMDHRRVATLGADPSHLLALVDLPMLRVSRAPSWEGLGEFAAELQRFIASAGS